MNEIERLTESEALALAGLLRALIRKDGRFSDPERDALSRVAGAIALVDDAVTASAAYRSEPVAAEPLGEERLYALIERAGEQLESDASLRAAALAVTRPEARAAIHALLFEVAASDVISKDESALLEWLSEQWQLASPEPIDEEPTTPA